MTHSCPGCGAPAAPRCAYCGRAEPEAQQTWRYLKDVPNYPWGCTMMSNGEPYIPPGKNPEKRAGILSSLLPWWGL